MEYLSKIKSILPEIREQILSIYNSDFDVYYKEDKSPVTEADVLVEKILVKFLSENFEFSIIGEESFDKSDNKKLSSYWVIDPIDGTMHFAKKTDGFCCSIGLVIDNKPYFGLIYKPVTNELYYAEAGCGSFYEKDDVVTRNSINKDYSKEVLISFNNFVKDKDSLKNIISKKVSNCREIYVKSSAVKLCELARGNFDIFPIIELNEWDIAAGHIILKEAGGNIYTKEKKEFTYSSNVETVKNVYATSYELIDKILD